MKNKRQKLDEISRRGFLGALGAAGIAAATPAVAVQALSQSKSFEPRITGYDIDKATVTVEIQTDQGPITIVGQVDPDTFDDSFSGSIDYGTYPAQINGQSVPDALINSVDDKFEAVTDYDFSTWVWQNLPLRVVVQIYDDIYGDDGPIEDIDDIRREAGLVASDSDDRSTAAQSARTAVATAARTQAAPVAATSVAAFKDLVQRVISAGQTAQPPAKDAGKPQPQTTTPALPAPDQSAVEIMAKLRDMVGRDLNSQEKSVVQQELAKKAS